MIRKTMRIGEVRTSIKLEPEFWGYLKEVADSRTIRLSRLVNDVAAATPERTNLASTLRTFCLIHAQLRWHGLEREIEQLRLAGNTRDLPRVLDACPLPCLLLDEDRTVKRLNQAFATWLHLDARGVLGQRLDNMMILRGQGYAGIVGADLRERQAAAAASMRLTSRRARCAPLRHSRSAFRRHRGRRRSEPA